jgi:DNA-binding CsgD family transcriptional regulator
VGLAAIPIETSPTPLAGRARELQQIAHALDAADSGHGAARLILGDAGVGKTRLCDEVAAAAAARGFTTLRGAALERGGLPFLPFAELLDAALTTLADQPFRAATRGIEDELARIAPHLEQLAVAASTSSVAAEGTDRPRVFAAVRKFLERLSRASPLLIIVDDAHWADEGSVLLLRYLARAVGARRVLMLITCRTGEGDDSLLRPLLDDLARSDGALLTLAELTPDAVGEVIAALAGRAPPAYVRDLIVRRIGGNPLFVEQVVRQLIDDHRLVDHDGRWIELSSLDALPIPASIRSVIERRLERVDAACRDVLVAAAVAGANVEYALLRDICVLDESALIERIESAAALGLLRPDDSAGALRLSFPRDLVRQAVLAGVSPLRRRRLHIAFAEAIERSCPVESGDYDAALAIHYLEAGSGEHSPKALHYVTAAARRALAATAYEDAARLYEEALALLPPGDDTARCDLLLALGDARKRISDSDAARDAFTQAAAIAHAAGDGERYARAALGFARSWPTVGTVDEQAVALLAGALAIVPPEATELRARLMARHALQTLYEGDPAAVLARARDAVAVARASGSGATLATALQVLHVALWQPHHLEERLAVASEIVQISHALAEPSIALWGLRPRIADLMELGDVERAEDDLRDYERRAAATRQPMFLWQAAVRKAMLALFRGQIAEGERLAQSALDLGRQAEGQNLMAAFGAQLLVVRWHQGRIGELRPLLEASRARQPGLPLWTAVLAFVEAESGRHAEARALFEELAADRFAAAVREDSGLLILVLLSLVCPTLGDGIRAEQLFERLSPYEGRNLVVSEGVACFGAAAGYLGILAASARRFGDAERLLRSAVEANARSGGRPWLAHAQFELARLLLRRRAPGDRHEAAALARVALGVARDCGLRNLQDRVEQLLRAHRGLAQREPAALTQREAEVLRLVAQGRSTREISEALVLSPRTTARHITNIYAKIGARNRVEAAAYAARHGLGA